MARIMSKWSKAPRTRSAYPYDQWFDGQIWRLQQGEDFKITVNGMVGNLHKKAQEKGGTCETRSSTKQGWLELQFVPGRVVKNITPRDS